MRPLVPTLQARKRTDDSVVNYEIELIFGPGDISIDVHHHGFGATTSRVKHLQHTERVFNFILSFASRFHSMGRR